MHSLAWTEGVATWQTQNKNKGIQLFPDFSLTKGLTAVLRSHTTEHNYCFHKNMSESQLQLAENMIMFL